MADHRMLPTRNNDTEKGRKRRGDFNQHNQQEREKKEGTIKEREGKNKAI